MFMHQGIGNMGADVRATLFPPVSDAVAEGVHIRKIQATCAAICFRVPELRSYIYDKLGREKPARRRVKRMQVVTNWSPLEAYAAHGTVLVSAYLL